MTDIFPKEMYLEYAGRIDFTRKKELLIELDSSLVAHGLHMKTRRQCMYVAEELLTNAHEYYKKNGIEEEPVSLTIKRNDADRLELSISNTIDKADIQGFTDKLENLNRLSETELRDLLESCLKAVNTQSMGGGVGLITIRLKTGFGYSVTCKEKNANQYLLSIQTNITVNL